MCFGVCRSWGGVGLGAAENLGRKHGVVRSEVGKQVRCGSEPQPGTEDLTPLSFSFPK